MTKKIDKQLLRQQMISFLKSISSEEKVAIERKLEKNYLNLKNGKRLKELGLRFLKDLNGIHSVLSTELGKKVKSFVLQNVFQRKKR